MASWENNTKKGHWMGSLKVGIMYVAMVESISWFDARNNDFFMFLRSSFWKLKPMKNIKVHSREKYYQPLLSSHSSRDISCFCFVFSAQCSMLRPLSRCMFYVDDVGASLGKHFHDISHTSKALFIQLFCTTTEIFPAVSTQQRFLAKTSDGHLKNHT